jgi:membrane associated rhomboid family serine protease
MLSRFLDKLQRKFGRVAIPNLMNIIVGGMAIVFIIDMIAPVDLYSTLSFSTQGIRDGQLWRLIMFVFLPPNSSLIFIIFSLYFYWMIGSSLEGAWGAFKFNVFYLTGVIGALLSGLVTGYATNSYINMSLFLAFAILYPNYEIRLFFILPVKMKWLALLDAAFFVFMLIFNTWPGRIAALVSLLNIILFFGMDAKRAIEQAIRRAKWRRGMRRRD